MRKRCCSQHAKAIAADTVNWCKNQTPKLEETCLGPESGVFEIPGQLHADINPDDLPHPPPTIHKDIFVGISYDDPLFDEAASILSNCFPSREPATIRTFVEDAYETIRAEVEAGRESSSSLDEPGTCPSFSANRKGVDQESVDRSTSSASANQVCHGPRITSSMKKSTTINSLHGM